MKIKLYKNVWEEASEEELKPIELTIEGKLATYCEAPDPKWDSSGEIATRTFIYERDTTYTKRFKKIKPNHRFEIYSSHDYDDSFIAGLRGYAHLSFFQRCVLDWSFERTWLQKSENIKWLISIPISILIGYITARLTK